MKDVLCVFKVSVSDLSYSGLTVNIDIVFLCFLLDVRLKNFNAFNLCS